MKKNPTLPKNSLTTFGQGQKPEKKAKLTQQSGNKSKSENRDLDGVELFSKFTADIIKQEVVFTR